MAEGDTLARARLRLAPVLDGQLVTEFWTRKLRGHRPRSGQRIEQVRSVGKHLLIDFDKNLTLETHLGMNGSWRVYPDRQLARNDRKRFDPYLKVLIATEAGYALCFRAPTIKTFIRGNEEGALARLGPDLCDPAFDLDEILRRVARMPETTELIDVLLNQSVACGVGNIYKSETLHIQKHNPFLTIGDMTEQDIKDLFNKAAELLQRNSVDGKQRRSITPQKGFFVYERFRKPCLRCDTPISRSYRGTNSRSTYWCPTCQPKKVASNHAR